MIRYILSTLILISIFLFAGISAAIEFDVKEFALENGLKVLILEDHSAPVVSYIQYYHAGSKNEQLGRTGISHLFEHMFFKGTKMVGPEEHDVIIQSNGGIDNAWTGWDCTCFYENLPSDKLEVAIRLESDRQQNLNLTNETLESEREVVKEERRWRTDNDITGFYGAIAEQIQNFTFVAHPYHWEIIGFMNDLDHITLEDCLIHYRIYYAPNNSVVIIAGDINSAEAMRLMQKYYGSIPSQEPPPAVTMVEPPQEGERRADFHRAAQLPAFAVSYHIPNMSNPEFASLELLNNILFEGRSSRAYKRMIYDEQMAQMVNGEVLTCEQPGWWYMMVRMQEGFTTADGEKALYEEMERLKSELVLEKELLKAKNKVESDLIFGLQTNENRGTDIGYWQVLTGDYHNLYNYLENVKNVTPEQIREAAVKYLDSKNRTVVTLVPLQSEED